MVGNKLFYIYLHINKFFNSNHLHYNYLQITKDSIPKSNEFGDTLAPLSHASSRT